MLPMGISRPSRQKSLQEGQHNGKVLPALEGKAVSTYWLSCNKSPPKGLHALSEEHKRDRTRWDETVGVSEGFDPSSSPGITKENTPSLLHSHRVQGSLLQVAVVQEISTFLRKQVSHLSSATCPELLLGLFLECEYRKVTHNLSENRELGKTHKSCLTPSSGFEESLHITAGELISS